MNEETNMGTVERERLVLPNGFMPNGFDALNVLSKPDFIESILNVNIGNYGLVDICRESGKSGTYHPDGIYEIARFGETNSPGVYTAEILDEDGSLRRVRFSVSDLGGVLVPKRKRSGSVFPIEKNPGRFSKMKLRGPYSYTPKKVLETQVGNTVLVNTSGRPLGYGTYNPATVDSCKDLYCEISRLNSNGEFEAEEVRYDKIGGIFVAERNKPPKPFWTD